MDEPSLNIPARTIELAKAIWAFAGVIFVGASIFFGMKSDISDAKTMGLENKDSLSQLRAEREKSLEIWRQDRIDQAAFKSAVMTKLDRIERKLDR